MLKQFEVSGYKCFDEKIVLDFSDVRDYQFNTNCINDGFIGKMIIYGKNAIGKTVFSNALVDVGTHIGGNPRILINDFYYLNPSDLRKYAEFRYLFQFDNEQIEYIYRKEDLQKPIYERVSINGELLFEYDKLHAERLNISGLRKMSPTLILNFSNVNSVLGYVVANTPLSPDSPLRKTIDYIDRMFYTPVGDAGVVPQMLFSTVFKDGGSLLEFENFLKDAGINVSLVMLKDNDGKDRLYFNTSQPIPFDSVASSGTRTLYNLFIAYKLAGIKNTSLLVLDDFDAFYHFELAEHIVKLLQKLKSTQVVFTSHNTNLLSNRFMRPDCLFVMSKNNLVSLPNATKRELREGHNLEKMYMSGEFDE